MKHMFNIREGNIAYNGGFILTIYNVYEIRSRDWNIDNGESEAWRTNINRSNFKRHDKPALHGSASLGIRASKSLNWLLRRTTSTRGTSEIYDY